MRFLYCCLGANTTKASFLTASQGHGPSCAGCSYEVLSESSNEGCLAVRQSYSPPNSRPDSLINVLEQVAHRRRARGHSSASVLDQSFLRLLAAQPSPSGACLTSWCVQQCTEFKQLWLQAASSNEMPCTEAGLMLHEINLIEHLKQSSAQFWKNHSFSHPDEKALAHTFSSSNSSHNLAGSGQASAAARAPAQSVASGSSCGNPEFLDWLIFAEPPDCAVPPELQWAAAMVSTSSSGGDGSPNYRLASCG